MHVVDTTIARSGSLPAVPGQQSGYVPGVMQAEAELLAALAPFEANFEVWTQCGGYLSAPVSSRITEIDAHDGKLWTADNAVLFRESDPLVMGGRRRWVTGNEAQEGFRGTLSSPPSSWSGYTLIAPDFEARSLAQNNCIFGIGASAGARVTWYIDVAGRMRMTHGTGGNTPSFTGATIGVGVRNTLMLTQVNATGNIQGYVNSATPVTADTNTVTLAPPNSTAGGILGTADDAVDSHAKLSQIIVIRQAITDAGVIAAIMAACAKIRTFVPAA